MQGDVYTRASLTLTISVVPYSKFACTGIKICDKALPIEGSGNLVLWRHGTRSAPVTFRYTVIDCGWVLEVSFSVFLDILYSATIIHGYLCPGLMPYAAPRRFTCRHGIYVDKVLRAAYGAAVNECVEV